MHATSSPDSGEDRSGPAAAWSVAEGETLIGVCWLPGDRSPEPIIGEGRPDGEGRFGVPARFGDAMCRRSPTHYEWHALGMSTGEPVVELRRPSGMREVFRSRLVGIVLGHAAGDSLLQITAARLGEVTRPGELLARLGGDEFGLLLTSLPLTDAEPGVQSDRPASLRYCLRRAREVTEQLATPTEVAGVRISVEASVGVVVSSAGSADMNELLRRADIAMYQAKKGGARVAWYDSANDAASTDRLALIAELREALATDDQLVLALQPVVDLVSGAPTGVEALIRWKHPRRGQLSPADFVRAVENSELLGQFTRYVIDKALTAAAQWTALGLDVPVAVNLSARNLLDPRLPADVAELLRQHRMPASRLIVEITETVVMSEREVVDEVLAGLRALGVGLSVDDFGTGYSSLTFLTRIRVDELKVDRTFVGKMADSAEAAAIVRTILDLARDLGLRVVAEGVETADQRAALTALGCTAAQGFHFSKPMAAENVLGVLRSLAANAQPKVVPLRADGAS
jgi:diguanylate cyclase (GGDEF)-like protein